MSKPIRSRWQIENELLTKAFGDKTFMDLLDKDPRAAVQQVLGAPVPASVKIQVLHESPQRAYIAVPSPSHTFLGPLGKPPKLTGPGGKATRKMMDAIVAHRVLTDTKFRDAYKASARKAIADAVKIPMPDTAEIRTVVEDPQTLVIVLPHFGRSTYHA